MIVILPPAVVADDMTAEPPDGSVKETSVDVNCAPNPFIFVGTTRA